MSLLSLRPCRVRGGQKTQGVDQFNVEMTALKARRDAKTVSWVRWANQNYAAAKATYGPQAHRLKRFTLIELWSLPVDAKKITPEAGTYLIAQRSSGIWQAAIAESQGRHERRRFLRLEPPFPQRHQTCGAQWFRRPSVRLPRNEYGQVRTTASDRPQPEAFSA